MNATGTAVTRTLEVRPESTALAPTLVTGAVLILSDVLALLTAFGVSVAIRQRFGAQPLWAEYARLLPFLAVVPALFYLMDLYPGVLLNAIEELKWLTISVTFSIGLLVIVTYLAKEANAYSRIVCLLSWPISVACVVGGRALVRKFCSRMGWWGIPAVVVGSQDDVDFVVKALCTYPEGGIRVAAIHCIDSTRLDAGPAIESSPTIPYAIVVVPGDPDANWLRKIERIVSDCRRFLVVPRSNGLLSSWVTVRNCAGVMGLEVNRELLKPSSRVTKRILDLALIAFGALLSLPFVLAIAVAIKLTSPGPAFYGQERIGRGGQRFIAWKFRTMVQNADDLLHAYLERDSQLRQEWESLHKLKDDPRVTAVGRFLRRTSLDELPQLWNVVRGEMSLVGPRPIVKAEIKRYGESYDMYCKVRPGITGFWQVSGRNDTSYGERVALDVHYVRNWSVWFDFYLLAKTVGVVLRRQGAY